MLPLTVGTPANVKAEFTRQGQSARVDGVPAWESTNPAVVAVAPAADGMTAVLTPIAPGTVKITMTAQAGDTKLAAPPLSVTVQLPLADTAAIVPGRSG